MKKRFLIIFIVLFLIIVASEYVAYILLHGVGLINSAQLEMTLMVMGIVFPILFLGSMLYSYRHYASFAALINILSSVWLGILFYIFIASFIIVSLINFGYFLNVQLPIIIISNILIIFVLCLVTYGIINSNIIKIKRYNIKSDTLSKDWIGKKIVVMSDMHIGNIHHSRYIKKIIRKINKEKPDITFNIGDLVDGSSFPYRKWLEPFLQLESKWGNYYVEGNHEKYNREHNKFKSEIPKFLNDITDKKIIINNTQIIGLDYKNSESENETISRLLSLGYKSDSPSIVLMHDPKNIRALSKNNVSLVLSGHTHSGQFFPWTIIVRLLYKKYTHGLSYTDKTASVTSSGIGSSMIPIRIGTHSEIVIINIE